MVINEPLCVETQHVESSKQRQVIQDCTRNTSGPSNRANHSGFGLCSIPALFGVIFGVA